jgi:putative transcriptional regulator
MIKLNLETLLAERGRSYYWLANEAKINHAVMSKMRHNRTKAITLDVLDRICSVLNCEPGDVLIRAAEEKPASKKNLPKKGKGKDK